MKVSEAAWTEELERELIRLSADWEAENSTWGYRANAHEDLAGRRVFLAEEDGVILGYLFGLRENAKQKTSFMDAGTPYFEIEELYVIPSRRSQGVGRALFACAEEDGAICGYLFGLRESSKQKTSFMDAGTPYFEIEELYVIPSRRSQGVGRALFACAEETLRAEGLPFLMLSTATKNARAILHFYLDELDMEFWSARLFKRLE